MHNVCVWCFDRFEVKWGGVVEMATVIARIMGWAFITKFQYSRTFNLFTHLSFVIKYWIVFVSLSYFRNTAINVSHPFTYVNRFKFWIAVVWSLVQLWRQPLSVLLCDSQIVFEEPEILRVTLSTPVIELVPIKERNAVYGFRERS